MWTQGSRASGRIAAKSSEFVIQEYLAEEIPKTTVLHFGVSNGAAAEDYKFGAPQLLNRAHLLHKVIGSSIYIPLDLGGLKSSMLPGLQCQNLYH